MNTVLLVDDNVQVRACLAGVLRVFGFRVFTADDGLAGLRAIERVRPDVIVCDVEMPRMDGFGMLRQVRALPDAAQTPFLFLTGLTDTDSRQLAFDLGANDYLSKPVAPWDLLEAIRRQLDTPVPAAAPPGPMRELLGCGVS